MRCHGSYRFCKVMEIDSAFCFQDLDGFGKDTFSNSYGNVLIFGIILKYPKMDAT